jgi:hypothetical protein
MTTLCIGSTTSARRLGTGVPFHTRERVVRAATTRRPSGTRAASWWAERAADDQRQRDAERGHAQRRYRFEANPTATAARVGLPLGAKSSTLRAGRSLLGRRASLERWTAPGLDDTSWLL